MQRATTSGGPYTTLAANFAGTTFVDSSAVNEDTYFYVVSAIGSGGESATSIQVQATPRSPRANVLLVVGSPLLGAGDAAVEARLRQLGFLTMMREGGQSTSADSVGKSLVIVSSTITSGSVNTKFKNVGVPVINWENALHDDFGMSGLVAGTDYGTTTGQTALAIQNPGHPLAAGLSGTVTVSASTPYSWGVPGAGAAFVASLSGNAARAVIFGYEAGAAMPGGTAPARRVGFFLEDFTAASMNGSGFALLDAAVTWATGGSGSTFLPPPSGLGAVGGNAQVSLSWTASAGAATYTLQRATLSGGPYAPVTTGISGTSVIDSGLTNGQTYFYRVQAVSGTSTSGLSNEAVATPVFAAASALLVVGNTTLGTGDQAVKSRLETLGFSVLVKDGASSASSDAAGKALVVISSSITSSTVGTKFRTSSVPVLNWENALHDDFGMTALTAGTDFGTTTGQTTLSIAAPGHALAGGLSGSVPVTFGGSIFSWGVPNTNAVKVATLSADPAKAVIFGYEVGAVMPGLTAPARRVGLFLEDATAAGLTSSGWMLFDAAVRWATNATPGAPPAPTNLTATAGNGQVTLNWTAVPSASGYALKRSLLTGGPYAPVTTVSGVTTFADATVSNGMTYYYIVTAQIGSLESGASNEAVATPGPVTSQALLVVGKVKS